jgi:hypothetical protein
MPAKTQLDRHPHILDSLDVAWLGEVAAEKYVFIRYATERSAAVPAAVRRASLRLRSGQALARRAEGETPLRQAQGRLSERPGKACPAQNRTMPLRLGFQALVIIRLRNQSLSPQELARHFLHVAMLAIDRVIQLLHLRVGNPSG